MMKIKREREREGGRCWVVRNIHTKSTVGEILFTSMQNVEQ